MNIVIINHNTKDKGTYFRCLGFTRELAKKGHSIYFFYLNPQRIFWPQKYEKDGANFIELPFIFNSGVFGLMEHACRGLYIFFFILFKKTDIVHCFNVASPMVAFSTILVYLVRKIKRIKLVVDWDDWWGKGGLTTLNHQGNLQEIVADFLETKIPLLADKITLHSETIKERAIQSGVKEKNIYKIYNGANIDAYQDFYDRDYDKNKARKEMELPEEKTILFFGGAIVTSVPFLLNVVEKLKNEDILLLIIGPIEDKFLKIVNKLNLKNNVEFKGIVKYDDYKKYLFAADILLLPRSEKSLLDKCTFPGRLGDYMLSGRPIVASDVGELSRIFREDGIGILAKPDNIDDFVNKIFILMKDKKLQMELENKALEAGKNKYSWRILTDDLIKNVYSA